jgi:chromosome segregation ATPase
MADPDDQVDEATAAQIAGRVIEQAKAEADELRALRNEITKLRNDLDVAERERDRAQAAAAQWKADYRKRGDVIAALGCREQDWRSQASDLRERVDEQHQLIVELRRRVRYEADLRPGAKELLVLIAGGAEDDVERIRNLVWLIKGVVDDDRSVATSSRERGVVVLRALALAASVPKLEAV